MAKSKLIPEQNVFFILENEQIDCCVVKGDKCVKLLAKKICYIKDIKQNYCEFDFYKKSVFSDEQFLSVFIKEIKRGWFESSSTKLYIVENEKKYFVLPTLIKLTKNINVDLKKYYKNKKKEFIKQNKIFLQKQNLLNKAENFKLEDFVK